ncbi:MAG: glycosyltransferase [Patescibacteria group bacterium]
MKINKKTVLFIDHKFHQKTKSTEFFIEILKKDFEVEEIWVDRWQGKGLINLDKINSGKVDFVIFFQVLPPVEDLKKINKPIIWIPMYDQAVNYNRYFWKRLSSVQMKIISFSSTLTKYLEDFGFDILSVRYFRDPGKFQQVENKPGLKIFFWQRAGINFRHLKRLIGDAKVDTLYLKLDTDPGYKLVLPTSEDEKKFRIKKLGWFKDKADLEKTLLKCNVFVAPRKYEGIGMSFLEAMTLGLAVIASDTPTMNEYITNQKNGYLFNFNHPSTIDFSRLENVMKNARLSCETGYRKWLTDEKMIIRFIQSEPKSAKKISQFGLKYLAILELLSKLFAIVIKSAKRIFLEIINGNIS